MNIIMCFKIKNFSRALLLLLIVIQLPVITIAQENRTMPSHYQSPGAAPQSNKSIRKIAQDEPSKPQTNFNVLSMPDNEPFFQALGDRLEYRKEGSTEIILWDLDLWYGNDNNKLYIESEGRRLSCIPFSF